MKVLIVKTSSMGDLIHTLPALTDAARIIPGIRFDWVAEEGFTEIPDWHPAVDKIIPVAIRRWRKHLQIAWQSGEITAFVQKLKQQQYDAVIDAQGLIKSAIITRLASGLRGGMGWHSCREPLASLAYQQRYSIEKHQHAIDRVRQLFSLILNYPVDSISLDYGLDKTCFSHPQSSSSPYLVFLHGASRPNKLWPDSSWIKLANIAQKAGYSVYLPWGNQEEHERAKLISMEGRGQVLPKLSLTDMAGFLAHATGVVGVDTGLAHLTAALDIPNVTLYLTTDPKLTGTRGSQSICLSHCTDFQQAGLSVQSVWESLSTQVKQSNKRK